MKGLDLPLLGGHRARLLNAHPKVCVQLPWWGRTRAELGPEGRLVLLLMAGDPFCGLIHGQLPGNHREMAGDRVQGQQAGFSRRLWWRSLWGARHGGLCGPAWEIVKGSCCAVCRLLAPGAAGRTP